MRFGKKFVLPVLACTALAIASTAFAGPSSVTLNTPIISCVSSTASSITVQVCGGAVYGAPGGFSIHMKTLADYNVDGWAPTGSYTCLSLGGNCQGGASQWSLGDGDCANVEISATTVADYAGQNICGVSSDCGIDPLLCNTTYVFRVFAHGDGGAYKASDKGPEPPLQCTTAACNDGGGCTYTWGYWKTHGPVGCSPGNQANEWDLANVPVGGLSLSQADACAILQNNPNACGKGGGANAVLILEHQLIAAELNVANGAISCPFANQAIIDANALLVGRENDCVGTASVLGQQMIAVKDLLAAYNNDICSCLVPADVQQGLNAAPSTVRKSTWGKAKSIYR
jgi:hypothetical protein